MSVKQAINEKLQSCVATYLRCGGTVNMQNLKKCFIAESVSEKIKIGEYFAKLQARTLLSRALSSSFSSVVARLRQVTDIIIMNREGHNSTGHGRFNH